MSVLTVNGETIKAVDLCRDRRDVLERQAQALAHVEYKAFVKRESVQWITDKITETLLYERASRHYAPEMQANIDKYVGGEIRKIVTASHGGVQRRYEKHLAKQGLDIEVVRAELRREIIIAGYLESEVKPRIAEPTRTDLLAAFNANRDSYRKPPRRSMSLIDVRVRDRADPSPERKRRVTPAGARIPPAGARIPSAGARIPSRTHSDERLSEPSRPAPRDETRSDEIPISSPPAGRTARDEARSIIETAQVELASGKSFADVAARYSDGLHKNEGGAWGWVRTGSVRERFEPAVEALYELGAGEVSQVIEVDDGFLLVRCDDIDPGFEPSFQDVQPALRESYSRASYNQLITQLIAELRSKALIHPANLERFHAAVVKAALDREFTETQ